MPRILAPLLALVLALAAAPALAQGLGDYTDLAALRKAASADKRAVVANALDLTPAEAKKFWPIYDDYQAAIQMNNRRATLAVETLIARDRPLTDAYAKSLVNELLAVDDANLRARKAMQSKVLKVLPAKKAARYLQIENKIRAVDAYDVAAALPLVK